MTTKIMTLLNRCHDNELAFTIVGFLPFIPNAGMSLQPLLSAVLRSPVFSALRVYALLGVGGAHRYRLLSLVVFVLMITPVVAVSVSTSSRPSKTRYNVSVQAVRRCTAVDIHSVCRRRTYGILLSGRGEQTHAGIFWVRAPQYQTYCC